MQHVSGCFFSDYLLGTAVGLLLLALAGSFSWLFPDRGVLKPFVFDRLTRDCQATLQRKKFFTMRVVKHWHRLPREAVDAPSLEVFKARLDGALSNLL